MSIVQSNININKVLYIIGFILYKSGVKALITKYLYYVWQKFFLSKYNIFSSKRYWR